MSGTLFEDIEVVQGKTFRKIIRWEVEPMQFKQITAFPSIAPATLTVPSHGLVTGARVAFSALNGFKGLNTRLDKSQQPLDWWQVVVSDSDTIQIPNLNPLIYGQWAGTGYVQFNSLKDLASATALFSIKDKVGGTVIWSATETTGVSINNVDKTLAITIPDSVTEAITYKKGVYELEVKDGQNVKYQLARGNVVFVKEVAV